MLPSAFSHRLTLSALASLLLHALVLWAVWAGVLQHPAPPTPEARLQVVVLAQALPEARPKAPPVQALAPQRPVQPATTAAALPPPALQRPAPIAVTAALAPPPPAAAAVQATLSADGPSASSAATGPQQAAGGSASAGANANPNANGTATPAPAAMPGTAAAPRVDLPSSNAAYLHNPKPVYPRRSERLGEQGVVLLNVLVTAAGRVKEVSIKSSSGFERLDQAAREAVLAWTFVPGKSSGVAQEMAVDVPIRFQPQE